MAAAVYALKDSLAREGTRLPGFDFDETLPASADPKVSAATLEKAEKVMCFLTCACKRVWDASQVPPGKQYSWNKIWHMRAEDPERHVAAMQAEMDKLIAAGHMEWADLPAGIVAVPGVSVFRLKEHDLHAQGVLLKARMCFNGKQAEPPPGGWETTVNVALITQILMVIAVATDLGLKMKQIDVKSVFTQVALPDGEEIYLRPLPGLKDPEGKGRASVEAVASFVWASFRERGLGQNVARHSHKVWF